VAWSWLQSCISPDNGNAGSNTATFTTANLSSGSTLVAAVSIPSSAGALGTCSSVKDGAGNNFILIGETHQGGAGGGTDQSIWALNTPAGDVGAKPAITATSTDNASTMCVLVQEISGLATGATAGALADGSAGFTVGTAGGASGPPSYTASLGANEYLVYVYADAGFGTSNTPPGSPYTADTNNRSASTNSNVAIAYKNSTGSAETGTWSAAAGSWVLGMVAFQISGGGAPAPILGQAPRSLAVSVPMRAGWQGAGHSR
jgi:hypothetical protein